MLFRSQSSTFKDNSTNAFTITRNGDTAVNSVNPFQNNGTYSMYFDGTGDYLTTPASPSMYFGAGDFTIEFWMYQVVSTGAQYLVAQNSGTVSTSQFDINVNNGALAAVLYYGASYLASATTTITTGTWTYITLVRSTTTATLYKNGSSVGTIAISTNTLNSPTTAVTVGSIAGGTYPFNGYITDLRITKYARYTTTFTPPTSTFQTK